MTMVGGLKRTMNRVEFNLPFSKSSCLHLYGIALVAAMAAFLLVQNMPAGDQL